MSRHIRGFEILNKFNHSQDKPQIPQRATSGSAGYDIRANETITVPSIIKCITNPELQDYLRSKANLTTKKFAKAVMGATDLQSLAKAAKPTMVHTGIKAYMDVGEVLYIFNRSSNPGKRGLYLANGVGVVDSDYYNNPSNEGELLMAFIELSPHDYTIHKGDRVAQGVFAPYLVADNDHPVASKRSGGFGSTGK